MPCEICGQTLLCGIDGTDKKFCPKCEGLSIREKKDSLRCLGEEIAEYKRKIEKIFSKYTEKSIIGSLYTTREIEPSSAKGGPFNPKWFLGSNLAIKYAFEYSNFGKEDMKKPLDNDFQSILHYSGHILDLINLLHLISQNYCVQISIPQGKDPGKYMLERNITAILYGETPETIQKKVSNTPYKFTEEWLPILANYKKFGLCTETEQYHQKAHNKMLEKRKELFQRRIPRKYVTPLKVKQDRQTDLDKALSILNSLELGDLSRKLLNFEEFKDDLETIIPILKILSSWALDNYKGTDNVGSLKPIHINDLLIFLNFFYDPGEATTIVQKLVSTKAEHKDFPLLILLDDVELLVGPYSIYLIAMYLTWKQLELDKINQLKTLEGYGFEKIVKKKLESIGIVIDYLNYKDDPRKPTFEIDLIAHLNNVVFVIECKNWLLTSSFLFRSTQKKRVNELTEQSMKQIKRIKYVEKNIQLLGLSEQSSVKSVIITKLQEPVDKINDSYVIPFDKINDILTIN